MQRRKSANEALCILNSSFCIRKIAIFRALYLGDLLCATPALRALRRRFPEAEITLIGLPWAAELARRLPSLDRFEVFPGYPGIMEVPVEAAQTLAYLDRASSCGYDLAIQMHGDGNISNGFVADLGAKITLGYRRGRDRRLTVGLPYDDAEHEVLRWLRLVDALQISDCRLQIAEPSAQSEIYNLQSTIALDFPITSDEDTRAAELLPAPSGRPLIGLHVGAKDMVRRWPTECFAALGDALAERYGAEIVLTGAAKERELTAAVRRRMRHPACDLAGATELGVFGAVIARLDLLVTNDTGASHIAAATGTRSVVLFGFSRPQQWAPLDRACHHALDALALAGPGAKPEDALARLPVAPVLAACEAMLQATADDGRPTIDDSTQAIKLGRPSSAVR